MKKTRKILITNDDSINAEGINLLAEIMRNYGEVTVVAPLLPQSGKSAALSLGQKLFLNKIHEEEGLRKFTFTGTGCSGDQTMRTVCLFVDVKTKQLFSAHHTNRCVRAQEGSLRQQIF